MGEIALRIEGLGIIVVVGGVGDGFRVDCGVAVGLLVG
jgi:hypothetical protein